MSSKKYFAYIRVSTVRQGQTGTSLAEQRASIERHAGRWSLEIIKEFEEQETAAKRGRPVFISMLRDLKRGLADGVVMHKIDRSARNLRDWVELGELIDRGIEVRFANENLDLYSRGGRLSADIQAVVAADYIRNLREEVKKGFYGRIKQGFFPMPAPVGYLDRGAGKAKAIDPVRGPLVKKAFELYASGNYGLRALCRKLNELGLQTKFGKKMTSARMSAFLRNPFYMGIIRLKTSDEVFIGQHAPLVSRKLFDVVQNILDGKKVVPQITSHEFLFRKLLTCVLCKYHLVGERQKGNVYYRCHTMGCRQSIKEEIIDSALADVLKALSFEKAEMDEFRKWYEQKHRTKQSDIENQRRIFKLKLEQSEARLSRLTDALVDNLIEEEIYTEKKNNLVLATKELKEKLATVETNELEALSKTEKFLELVNSAYSSYKSANYTNRRNLVQTVTSNFFVNEKSVSIKLNLPFELVINRKGVRSGGPFRNRPRTLAHLVDDLIHYFSNR
jgi:site-specific DNA recombinase